MSRVGRIQFLDFLSTVGRIEYRILSSQSICGASFNLQSSQAVLIGTQESEIAFD